MDEQSSTLDDVATSDQSEVPRFDVASSPLFYIFIPHSVAQSTVVGIDAA